MIQVEHIAKAFGPKAVLDDITFTIPSATLAGLIGPSGGGKSLLLKILGHVSHADSGKVMYDVQTDTSALSLMFQEGALFDSLSVFDNVAFPLVNGRVPSMLLPLIERKKVTEKVSEILARVGLSKAAFKLPGQISGGMRRRVSLARALVTRPRIMLLDDPTSGLDPVASSVIMDLIVELHHEYKPTTLIVSHDLRRLLPVVDTVLTLFNGTITFQGSLQELAARADPAVQNFVACRFDLGKASGHAPQPC